MQAYRSLGLAPPRVRILLPSQTLFLEFNPHSSPFYLQSGDSAMDPLSTTASIIAVLQLTGVVVNYLNTVKNASKDQKRCALEASNLFALLTKLKYLLEEATPTDHLYATAREIITENGILDQYKAALERLVAKVVPKDGARNVAAPFLWQLDKKEIDEIFETIERLKSQILIVLEMGHL